MAVNYALLLDAYKVFDKVMFNVFLNGLSDRSVCQRNTKLLHYMYTNQTCYVKWGTKHCDRLMYRMV